LNQEAVEAHVAPEDGALDTRQVAEVAISVLLPAFNEEDIIKKRLEEVSQCLSGTLARYEIIVIDDGSTDGTRLVASEAMTSLPLKVVGYPVNRGKGAALKYGSRFASGEVAIILDSDAEIEASNLTEYAALLRENDLVIGSKRHLRSQVRTSVERKFLSIGFYYLVRLLTGIRYSDTQAGLKAFRTSALKRIMPLTSVKKYAFDVELLTIATLLGMRAAEIPVKVQLSEHFSIRNMARMGIDLLGIAYRLHVLKWYQHNLSNGSPKYEPILRW
jgi:glycosyltransferase involved in cell wall biosynthesis